MNIIQSDMPQEWRYPEKLKDVRWRKARRLILVRDDYTCQICGAKEEWGFVLHVHHIKYLKGKEPWEYPPAYFVTLCKKCHEDVHCIRHDDRDKYAVKTSMKTILDRMRWKNGKG